MLSISLFDIALVFGVRTLLILLMATCRNMKREWEIRELSFQEVRNRGLLLPEPSSDNLESCSWMKLRQLWILRVKKYGLPSHVPFNL